MTLNILENLAPALNQAWPGVSNTAWRFVLTTAAGENRCDAKVTVFVFNVADAVPLGVLKTSLTADDRWLKNQYNILQFLDRLPIEGILYPRPIAIIENEQYRFYLESYVEAKPVFHYGKRLHAVMLWAVEWLTNLHRVTSSFNESAIQDLSALLTTWWSVIEHARCLKSEVIHAARSVVENALVATGALPTVFMHGDFHPNQFLRTDKARGVGIVDWEHAACRGWPVLDLIELLATTAYLDGKYTSTPHAFQSLFMQPKPHPSVAGFLENYWQQLKLPMDSLKIFLGVYCLHSLAQIIALRGDILPIPAIIDWSYLLLKAWRLVEI
ncbi:MAG TPA: aminoglycoside phosphotransferase family protein [Anaerolineae bacterium]|nr:aminoglycoside phosphotransferase family protein [Anaerolineae bacterium]HQK14377.1 aminoglycoside phosphotransferase family protein [Anaerolineae bacterium]